MLFVRGAKGPEFSRALAVVGTRKVTPYGREVCEQLCTAVVRAGVAIISGLARGVDAIAHRVAVDEGVPTVAVLAGGFEAVYPRENAGLADRVMENGCIVSEYPVGVKTRPDYFPRRNRIISGLARATLVVEAGAGSGALHTANHALEQNREVFAVPGERLLEAEHRHQSAHPREHRQAGVVARRALRGAQSTQHRRTDPFGPDRGERERGSGAHCDER